MDKTNFDSPNSITISPNTLNALLSLGDGNAALLYLYLTGGGLTKTSAERARDLGWSNAELDAAEESLTHAGLMPSIGGKPTPPAPKTPITATPALGGASRDGKFFALVKEVQHMLGRILSPDDTERLLGIYDTLQLPGEVVLQLVNFCIAETSRKGNMRAPSMKYIEKAAYTWEREGIFTLEAAEEYIKRTELRRDEVAVIRRVLQIDDRELLPAEQKYVDTWLERGFNAETIGMAYERMMMQTGKRSWAYMDKIIANWHEKDLCSAAEIAEKDSRGDAPVSTRTQKTRARSVSDNSDIERMNRLIENMKKAKK